MPRKRFFHKQCQQHGLKKPPFEQDGDFKVTIWRQATEQVQNQLNILAAPMLIKDILKALNLNRPTMLGSYIKPAIALNLVEMTGPASPQKSKQKYRQTKKGETFMK
ncbi:Fic family protein [Fibrobacter intestinalis]|uniref:Fic family protein n=1 Tax=Fibrobacter TaxID=832 RepID=UPI00099AA747|nr:MULTISPECIES: hypothetical protein [Fibrobacter]